MEIIQDHVLDAKEVMMRTAEFYKALMDEERYAVAILCNSMLRASLGVTLLEIDGSDLTKERRLSELKELMKHIVNEINKKIEAVKEGE